MQRASEVFHDIVLQHSPDLLSPQIDEFYDAATANEKKKPTERGVKTTEESHNDLNLGNITDILVGLHEMSLGQRRDTNDRDYPNKYYRDLVMPDEAKDRPIEYAFYEDTAHDRNINNKTGYVHLDKSYVGSWLIYRQKAKQIVDEHFNKLIKQSNDFGDLLKGLRGLSEAKMDAP